MLTVPLMTHAELDIVPVDHRSHHTVADIGGSNLSGKHVMKEDIG